MHPGADLGEKLRGARSAVGAKDEGVRGRSPRENFWWPRPLPFRKCWPRPRKEIELVIQFWGNLFQFPLNFSRIQPMRSPLTFSLQTANVILIINIWQMSYCKISNVFFAIAFCKHDEFFLARLERANIERNEVKEKSFGTVESSTAAAETCLSLCKDLSSILDTALNAFSMLLKASLICCDSINWWDS